MKIQHRFIPGGSCLHWQARGGRIISSSMMKLLPLLATVVLMAGCRTVDPDAPARAALAAAIRSEPPGNYHIGRRMFKTEYKMWGWVREPGQSWSSAKLVMMNEQVALAPDRAGGKLGTDNNVEYRIKGRFTGAIVYEPASDRFYPEYQAHSYEAIDRNPPHIYVVKSQTDPAVRILAPPVP